MAPTMPAGMPGQGGMFDPTISPEAAMSMSQPSMGPAPIGAMLPMDDPTMAQYAAITQDDGSVLLHLKNPDGTMGPAVKIIPPIKRGKIGG